MAKNTVIRKTLTSLAEPWCDKELNQSVDIEDIEAFLKSQLGSKIGYPVIPQTKDTDGYYHFWGFADKNAYNDYMTDPEANEALRLVNIAIPLLEEQGGVSNIVKLTRISSGSLVTSKPIASVEVSYLWQQYNPITQETTDQDEDATIVVSCRTQNSSGSHLLFYSCLAMDLGALTAFFYGFRDREKILDIFEGTCGGRLIMNYNTIGGVQADIAPDFQKKVKEFIPYLRGILHEYHDVFTGNIIAQQRLKGVGVLSREDAIAFGATGGTGRASGWACDVRKRMPYGVYDKVDFKEIVRTEGDSWARYLIRMDEIMESLKIIEQLIDNIPEGAYQEKMKPIIRVPEGTYYAAVEGSRGEFGVFLESHGDKTPYRLHFRSTGLPLVSTVDTICRGAKIADLIAIGGTLDYVVPDIDR